MLTRQKMLLTLFQFFQHGAAMLTDLYPREEMILRWLARGYPYFRIRLSLQITMECLHTHVYNIRQKTGILDTTDPQQCKDYIKEKTRRPRIRKHLKPTPTMLMAMEGVTQGYSYEHLAKGFDCVPQTIQNAVSIGCKRAGIVGQGSNRTQAIREYLLRLKSMVPLDAEGMF